LVCEDSPSLLILLVEPRATPSFDSGKQGRSPGAHPIIDVPTSRGIGWVQRVGYGDICGGESRERDKRVMCCAISAILEWRRLSVPAAGIESTGRRRGI
jgi:hypothetical protein